MKFLFNEFLLPVELGDKNILSTCSGEIGFFWEAIGVFLTCSKPFAIFFPLFDLQHVYQIEEVGHFFG